MASIPPMIVKLRASQGSTSELVLPGPEGIRFVALQPGVIDVPGFTPFAGMSLPNGIAAVLIRETHAIEPRHGADLERAINGILVAASEKGTDVSAPDVRLIIGFDHNPTGSKIVYDIAKPHTAPG